MDNAFGEPQTILVLGGTSDIGLAIVRELLSPVTRTVVLACRDVDEGRAGAAALRDGLDGRRGALRRRPTPSRTSGSIGEIAERHGDIDVVVVAFGSSATVTPPRTIRRRPLRWRT
jgi:decaprenylphospho-beta-D-erythro-pentofuranosid-2-ulose 2-reductase